MAIHALQGLMGAGKSCVAVNKFLADWLENSDRPIYTNLPLRWVGEKRHGQVVDGINMETGQPAELLELVADLTRNHAKRQAYMSRIHFLRPGERVPLDENGQPLRYLPLDDDGNPVPGAEPVEVGPKHGVREFWFFTKPNAVVLLDEVADIWSTEDRKNRPDTLKSYIRHHRHYKDDLYFFFQDKEDIDPDLRRKIQFLWTVRNSTKENIWDHWATRGIRWPVQFFFVKCYLGREVVGMAEDSMKRRQPQEAWNYWPSRRDFRHYWSFSQAGTLPGKKAASDKQHSTDFDPSVWKRIRGFTNNLAPLLAMLAFVVVLAFMGYQAIDFLLHPPLDKLKIGPKDQRTAQTSANPPGTFVTEARGGANGNAFLATRTNLSPLDAAALTNQTGLVSTERILLVTPSKLVTTRKTYVPGSDIDGDIIARFRLNGVVFTNGNQRFFTDIFLPGERIPGVGSGARPK